MGVIVTNIAAIFIIMGVGFFANKTGLLPEKANDYLSPLLIKVTSPCMIFNNIVSMDTGEGMVKEVLTMMAGAAVFFGLFALAGWFLCVKVMKLENDSNCGVYIMLFATINNGFMGLPITLEVFGEEAMFFMVFFQMMLHSIGKKIVNPIEICFHHTYRICAIQNRISPTGSSNYVLEINIVIKRFHNVIFNEVEIR